MLDIVQNLPSGAGIHVWLHSIHTCLRPPETRNSRIFLLLELESTYGCIASIRVCVLQRRNSGLYAFLVCL
ncbi:MAG: hypothetical protein OIN89_10655 [Candidatus Methanoperedens sp.]|nr:hypothetical protein [Candidatus Methanoperedens sp.]